MPDPLPPPGASTGDDPDAARLGFDRDARIFAARRDLVARLREQCEERTLVADELLHPPVPCDLVVRRGNLRLSELLADGREVTRAVLQTGAVCRVRAGTAAGAADDAHGHGEAAGTPLYSLASTVLMALGEAVLWLLPAGALDADHGAQDR
jgi:hypothetical protein